MTVVSVEHALAGRIPAGGEVAVRGWVRTRRDSKAGLSFVNVSDGSCFAPIQVVAPSTLDNYESEVKHLTTGCAVVATGTLVASQGQGQSFEIQASRIEVVGWVEDPLTYPMQPKQHSLEYLREFAHLRPRTNLFGAVARIRNCLALSKVYTFGPTFRAENSNTSRHLAEFWMIEPELAFADIFDNANLAEAFLKYIFKAVLAERMDDLAFLAERVEKTAISKLETFIAAPFERIDYTEAVSLLQKSGHKFEFPVEWGLDLQTEHERWLTEQHVGRPVVVLNYPEQIKSFYMRLNDDGRTVAAMDVLAPGIGEIIGGSQREERLDVLDARIAQFGLDAANYQWYRDFRRYGTVPHAGFGLGFERLVVYVCGLSNIRDAIPYPRAPGSAEF